MNRPVVLMHVLGLSLAIVASGWAAEANTEQAKAVAEIEKLGGKVTFDERIRQTVFGVESAENRGDGRWTGSPQSVDRLEDSGSVAHQADRCRTGAPQRVDQAPMAGLGGEPK